MSNKAKGQNKSLIIICIVAVVVIVILIGIIIAIMRSAKTDDSAGHTANTGETDKRPVLITEDNMDQMVEQILNRTEPEGVPLSYQVTMNSGSTWEFDDGQSVSKNAYVANSQSNETAVYFDVIINDTQETIYRSPVIPRGMDLDNIVLDVDLDAGDYECTMIYHLIDDDQNTLTTVNMWLMVIVEN